MKRRISMSVLVTALTVVSIETASAQVQAKQQIKQSETVQVPRLVQKPAQAPSTVVINSSVPGSTKANETAIVTDPKNLQRMNVQQLQIMKKQVAAKGLPTQEYDMAIKQQLQNLAR